MSRTESRWIEAAMISLGPMSVGALCGLMIWFGAPSIGVAVVGGAFRFMLIGTAIGGLVAVWWIWKEEMVARPKIVKLLAVGVLVAAALWIPGGHQDWRRDRCRHEWTKVVTERHDVRYRCVLCRKEAGMLDLGPEGTPARRARGNF